MKAKGKRVAGKIYAHIELVSELEPQLRELIEEARSSLQPQILDRCNVIRIDPEHREIGFLSYPSFFDEAFPALKESWKVRTDTGHVVYRTYSGSLNPPILHRKEEMLPAKHPERALFSALTTAAERAGLFEDAARIGLKQQWEALLKRTGLAIVGHELCPLANDLRDDGPTENSSDNTIARHLTALSRSYLSVPIQSLIRHGLLKPGVSLFDYGCGKGDDVRNLLEIGYLAAGWDPHYCPSNPQKRADVVNIGFVINVIEDFEERLDALKRAFFLADRVLAIGALTGSPPATGMRRHGDGVITSRNTFQKYYSPGELTQFVSAVLDVDALPAAPGVVYAFKDRALETNYLIGRYATKGRVARAQLPVIVRSNATRSIEKGARTRPPRRELPVEVKASLNKLWQVYLELGRRPDITEIPDLVLLLGGFRSLGRLFRYVESINEPEMLRRSGATRRDDLLVALALQLFARRKRFGDLDERLQLDIKHFFGSYDSAQREALALLQAIGDVPRLLVERDIAAAAGLGQIDQEGHLLLHSGLIGRLPALLRVYAGAATATYGDLASTDLVKLHVSTGKVTLMSYDDFVESPLPRMRERVKVDLKEQNLNVFEYGEQFEKPHLYRKSSYIDEEFPRYQEQVEFDEHFERLGLLEGSIYGPKPADLATLLVSKRWAIDGYRLIRSQRIPELDEKCGQYLTYRNLIECGETWESTRIDNRPKLPDSYTSLYELAVNVLDPVIEYFGMIKITYGFCSPDLARNIHGRIDPKLDQHASCELNLRGRLVCQRKGAAVDLLVEDEDMRGVAHWIATNTRFDRLYVYGRDRPIHVSYGPDFSGSIVEMRASREGRLIPRILSAEQLGG